MPGCKGPECQTGGGGYLAGNGSYQMLLNRQEKGTALCFAKIILGESWKTETCSGNSRGQGTQTLASSPLPILLETGKKVGL